MSLVTACTTEDNAVDPVGPQEEVITEFYNETVNKMIDENYEKVKANGYAKLVIPKSLYKEGLFTFPVNAASDMKCMVDAGYKAYKDHIDALKELDTYNSIYNMESGFNGGFALRYFKLLEQYKVTDYYLTSLTDRLQTAAYKDFVEGMLGEFDKVGKADMALSWTAIFWPRFADEITAMTNPTKDDVVAIWTAIDKANKENFKFDYKDYTYVPEFIQDVWYLQLQMTDPANKTDAKSAEIRKSSHFAEAQRFLKARVVLDSSLADIASYWE